MSHPYLVATVKECEEATLLKGKLTFIIDTLDNNIDRLMASLFSLLLRCRSVHNVLEHIIICIHGPDERTGSTKIQDKKQAFLEELRDLKWRIPGSDEVRDMPITIIRVWSRVGKGQAIDMAIPWVHTEAYAIFPDDYVMLNDKWVDHIQTEFFDKPDVGYIALRGWNIGSCENPGTRNWQLHMPRLDINFATFKKAYAEQCGLRFSCYFINHEFKVDEEYGKFLTQKGGICQEIVNVEKYNELVVEHGAWAKHLLEANNVKCGEFYDKDGFFHNKDLSWKHEANEFTRLEQDIQKIPEYWSLYSRYQNSNKIFDIIDRYRNVPIDPDLKPLVCVCVYDRYRTIINWLRAYKNANHYNCKLCIVQVYGVLNGEIFSDEPDETLSQAIQAFKPDYHLKVYNKGMDLRALHDLPEAPELANYPWNVVFWFTDDCSPMNREFLMPFMAAMSDPKVGMAGAFPECGYLRTVTFGLRRDAMQKLPWIADGNITNRQQCLQQENQLAPQVQKLGYKIISILPASGSEDFIHWSRFSDWLWDSDSTIELDKWSDFERQFQEKDRVPGSLEELSLVKALYGHRLLRNLKEKKFEAQKENWEKKEVVWRSREQEWGRIQTEWLLKDEMYQKAWATMDRNSPEFIAIENQRTQDKEKWAQEEVVWREQLEVHAKEIAEMTAMQDAWRLEQEAWNGLQENWVKKVSILEGGCGEGTWTAQEVENAKEGMGNMKKTFNIVGFMHKKGIILS